MKLFNKSIKQFDSFEKVAWSLLHDSRYSSVKDTVMRLEQHKDYGKVHYKDKWEVIVHTTIAMSKEEYSGNLIVVPSGMWDTFDKAIRRMCCGIHTEEYTCSSGRKYLIGFDYGH
jgi:hypothetical protein